MGNESTAQFAAWLLFANNMAAAGACKCCRCFLGLASAEYVSVRPIHTYRMQGANKPGIDLSAHAIIHMRDNPPKEKYMDRRLNKEPLKVNPDTPGAKLQYLIPEPLIPTDSSTISTSPNN